MLLPVLGHTYRNFFKVTGGGKVEHAGTASNQTADEKREDLEPEPASIRTITGMLTRYRAAVATGTTT